MIKNLVKWASQLNKKLIALHLILNILYFPAGATSALAQEIEPIQGFESLVQSTSLVNETAPKIAKRVTVTLTAYSSTPDQTDDSPFITASNTYVHDGIVAANFLPFKTRIMIPKLFGDKVFVVEDRMHSRFSDRVDIWFTNRQSAINFGVKTAEVIVL